MNHLVSEMVTYYHEERPHKSKDNEPLLRNLAESQTTQRKKSDMPPPDLVPLGDIKCQRRLGGLLKHYSRKAA